MTSFGKIGEPHGCEKMGPFSCKWGVSSYDISDDHHMNWKWNQIIGLQIWEELKVNFTQIIEAQNVLNIMCFTWILLSCSTFLLYVQHLPFGYRLCSWLASILEHTCASRSTQYWFWYINDGPLTLWKGESNCISSILCFCPLCIYYLCATFRVTTICRFVLILYPEMSFYIQFYINGKAWNVPLTSRIKWLGRNEVKWNKPYNKILIKKLVHTRHGDTCYMSGVFLQKISAQWFPKTLSVNLWKSNQFMWSSWQNAVFNFFLLWISVYYSSYHLFMIV